MVMEADDKDVDSFEARVLIDWATAGVNTPALPEPLWRSQFPFVRGVLSAFLCRQINCLKVFSYTDALVIVCMQQISG